MVNLGLSRRASKNYPSAGVSLNWSAELDLALLTIPNELHTQMGCLSTLADEAIARREDHQARPAA